MTTSPLPFVPSPNAQAASEIDPSGSYDELPFNVMASSDWVAWFGPAFATGAAFDPSVVVVFASVVVVVVAVPLAIETVALSYVADQAPALSRTQRTTTCVPAAVWMRPSGVSFNSAWLFLSMMNTFPTESAMAKCGRESAATIASPSWRMDKQRLRFGRDRWKSTRRAAWKRWPQARQW